jgi:hypothetical protein
VEMRLLDMLAAILQNLASHPANRTCMYRAELSGTTALDRALEGPSSPEPSDTSTALLATRLTLKTTGSSSGSKQQDSRYCSQQRCESPVLGSSVRAASAAAASTLCKSIDTALSASVLLRPKVLFPPISRSTAGMLAHSGGREQWTRAGSPDGLGPPASPAAPGGTANRGLPSRRGRGEAAGVAWQQRGSAAARQHCCWRGPRPSCSVAQPEEPSNHERGRRARNGHGRS